PYSIDCVSRGTNNVLFGFQFLALGGPFSGDKNLVGTTVRNPSCTLDFGNGSVCAMVGIDNALYGTDFVPSGSVAHPFQKLGGRFIGSPSCVNSGSGTATCAVRDIHNALVGIRFDLANESKAVFQTWEAPGLAIRVAPPIVVS